MTHRPPAAAAGRGAGLSGEPRASWSGWSTNTPRPTGSTGAGATGSPADRRDGARAGSRRGRRRARRRSGRGAARIDAWLCDLKDFAIKDGLHIYGRGGRTKIRAAASAEAERAALLAALDGRHVPPGPAGAPARGRRDVLPTGRNLFTADPRTLPTPTAFELGAWRPTRCCAATCRSTATGRARSVIDLWGSATPAHRRRGDRAGAGADGLPAGLGRGDRPRHRHRGAAAGGGRAPAVDVTWRISGLFRDMFPAQIALIDAAVRGRRRRATRATTRTRSAAARPRPRRASSAARRDLRRRPRGAAGERRLGRARELGRAYLDAGSHAFGGAEGEGEARAGRLRRAGRRGRALCIPATIRAATSSKARRDVAFVGGFAAAVAALGGKADLIMLDTTDPARPRARSLAEAVTRIVRARASIRASSPARCATGRAARPSSPRRSTGWSASPRRRTPWRGADRPGARRLCRGPGVRAFLLRENPAAARAIAERFASRGAAASGIRAATRSTTTSRARAEARGGARP